jgi:hypothetical protein
MERFFFNLTDGCQKEFQNNSRDETFEKCSILFKFKEDEDFNHRNTLSILRINPPKFGGGLKSESDVEVGQKRTFFKGLGVGS